MGRGGVLYKRLPNLKTELNIATYNVRTLSEEIHLINLEAEIKNIKWDIIGISEMRKPGEKIQVLKSGHLLYNSSKENKQNGVGFLIHKNLQSNIEKFTTTSDRVASVTLRISKIYRLLIIQVYAPTSRSSQEELDNFYDDIYNPLNTNKAHYNITVGDLNAKIGHENEECVGKFGYGERNERGEDLINFATAHNFKIMNTFFQKSKNKRWTWRSPNHETKNEIDFILIDRHNIVKNVDVLNQVNVGSDHRMVRCKIQINTKQERRKLFFSRPEQFKIPEAAIPTFQIELKNRFNILESLEDQSNDENSLDTMNKNIIVPLKEVAKKFQSRNPSQNSKFSEDTKNLMKKRRALKPPSSAREKIEAAELNKTIQKRQREDLRKHTTKVIEDVIKQGKGFKTAKRKLGQGKLQFTGVLEEDGSLTTNRDGIVKRARGYYEKLYSSERPRFHPREGENQHLSHGFPEITTFEVRLAIKQMKKGKAPGPDNITLDLIADADEPIHVRLAQLFNKCLKESKTPEEWNKAILILLYKKGDPRDMNNHRPISLLSVIYKIFTKVITNRIANKLDENQPREQAGFRKGYSTIDHLQTVHQIIEKTNEYKIPLVVALVDYTKAFDSVETEEVMAALEEQGVDQVYIRILRHIYEHATSIIRLHMDSEPFQLKRGVRQGDTSSPKLFTACLERAFQQLNWSEKGIRIDGEHLSHLRFADDIFVCAPTKEQLQEMLAELNQASKSVGLHMNFSKTKIMCNKYIEQEDEILEIENQQIEEVDHYIYLGQRISLHDSSKENEIKRRITLGWQAFGRANSVFKNKKIPIILKRKVYDQCILPTVTYGAETWNLTKKLSLKLRTMQRAHERIMLGITWRDRKTAEWVRQKTKVKDILETIRKLKWNWAGHVARMTDNRWTSRTTFWTPRGYTRNRGRQKTRWRDDLEQHQQLWHRTAQDRNQWKNLGKAYIQQRIT